MVHPVPENRAAHAEERADQHFERRMAQELDELLGLAFRLLEVPLDQAVEHHGLAPGGAPETGRIVHDDQAEVERDREQPVRVAMPQADRGGERGHGRGVGARHAAGLDEPAHVPAPGVEERAEPLVALHDEADGEGDPERFRGVLLGDPEPASLPAAGAVGRGWWAALGGVSRDPEARVRAALGSNDRQSREVVSAARPSSPMLVPRSASSRETSPMHDGSGMRTVESDRERISPAEGDEFRRRYDRWSVCSAEALRQERRDISGDRARDRFGRTLLEGMAESRDGDYVRARQVLL